MNTPLSEQRTVQLKGGWQPRVYVPKAFPEKKDDPMHVFLAYEIRYLDAIHRGLTHEKAVQAAGISEKKALTILKRKKAKEYLSDLMRQKMAAEGWTQDRWLSELSKVWYGQREASREQLEAIKEIGARVAPRPEKSSGSKEAPQIIINIGKIEAAIKRQEVIEAVDGTTGSTGTVQASL